MAESSQIPPPLDDYDTLHPKGDRGVWRKDSKRWNSVTGFQEYNKEERKADGQKKEAPNPGLGEHPGKNALPADRPGKRGPG